MEALQGNYGFVGVQELRTRTFFKVIGKYKQEERSR